MSEKEFTKPSNGQSRTIGDAKDMGIKPGLNVISDCCRVYGDH